MLLYRAHDLLKEARAGLAKSEIKMTNLEVHARLHMYTTRMHASMLIS